MNLIISSLVGSLTLENLYGNISPIIPYLIFCFGMAFGLYILSDFISTKRRSSMINNFLSSGGLHTDDERIRRWVHDLD